VPGILDAGHGFDLFDDGTLAEAQARGYKAVVLPGVRWMPEATRRWLADITGRGGTVLAVRREPDGDVSARPVAEANLAAVLAQAVPPDVSLAPATPAIGFVHRRLADADVYFLANTANTRVRVRARFRAATAHAERWDAMSGRVERLAAEGGEIALDFEPYGSRVVVFRAGDAPAPPATSAAAAVASDELRSGWTVAFGDGVPRPVDLPHSWAGEPAQAHFSGTATYRREVTVPASFRAPGTRVFLDFGEAFSAEREPLPGGTLRGNSFAALVGPPIREAATVFVNGRRAGSVWAPPYRVELTPLLREGANELRVEVYNTAINALAGSDRLQAEMKAVTERYGQRARLQDLEGLKPLPSGILSVPRLLAER
jgi:hypothetical protein